jgi:SAM-dependent methyltransferase
VGCGNGRAVLELLENGHNALGVDVSPDMVTAARQTLQSGNQAPDRIQPAALTNELPFADASFDAVSCCAVLMHLPALQLFDALHELKRLLRIGGRLFLSIPKDRPDVDPETHRDPKGRLFTPIQTHQLSLLCERMGLRLDQQTEEPDSLGREGIVWSNLCFTKQQIP